MDDRGKYIYISHEEMKAVADYIKREGKVSIAHLANKSNQFIDLEPKTPLFEDLAIQDEITVAWCTKLNHIMWNDLLVKLS